ncbi:hypothetical protein H7347_03615 [Corynebacterium sp. zg-331]|uniref:hypothetical protein n=1 Tax=unclassified Corynebacterium TaxID=2624378 RepID=UPI001642B156|nr:MULTISPECIES: hypothetical protein [unclassified Corynebacterium]MBC3185670.1 hypothetical protein [Corynebacterium sp. zg-331]
MTTAAVIVAVATIITHAHPVIIATTTAMATLCLVLDTRAALIEYRYDHLHRG